eukprot:6479379-Amphidinium_carterae.1
MNSGCFKPYAFLFLASPWQPVLCMVNILAPHLVRDYSVCWFHSKLDHWCQCDAGSQCMLDGQGVQQCHQGLGALGFRHGQYPKPITDGQRQGCPMTT